MFRLRFALVFCLAACAALMPWSHGVNRVDPVEPVRVELAKTAPPAAEQIPRAQETRTETPAEVGTVAEPMPLLQGPQPFALLARFGETRLQHPAPVWSVALSTDGRTLATTTQTDPVVRLWDATTGRLIREVRGRDANANLFTLGGLSADARHLHHLRHRPRCQRSPWRRSAMPSKTNRTVRSCSPARAISRNRSRCTST